jgi:hypothetical protein
LTKFLDAQVLRISKVRGTLIGTQESHTVSREISMKEINSEEKKRRCRHQSIEHQPTVKGGEGGGGGTSPSLPADGCSNDVAT